MSHLMGVTFYTNISLHQYEYGVAKRYTHISIELISKATSCCYSVPGASP